MRKAGKTLQKSEPRRQPGRPPSPLSKQDGEAIERMILERTIRAEIENGPERMIERSERYKRMLLAGTTGTFYVINAAAHDDLADEALREHIAALLDQGRHEEMSTQLRAYAVKYLVHPRIEFTRQRDG